ncbi:MAG: hypothetical protein IKX89_01365 [Firmicutes bacterium]|nr:hypothetical protein [Bacillota bacterium]
MITTGIFGGLALLFIGIAVLVLISSLIRLAGPILIILGIYYVYKTIKARNAQEAEAEEGPIEVHFEETKPKDEAEILAEKYEGLNK